MIIRRRYYNQESIIDLSGFENRNFDKVDLSNAILSDLNLSVSSMKETKLAVADLRNSNLKGSDLNGAELRIATLENTCLDSVNLENVDAVSVLFRNSDLSNACLKRATLCYSDFIDANLRNTDLTNANFEQCILYGADMRGINIETANFQGAVFDQKTRWPEGFNPYSKGAKLVGNPIKRMIEDLNFYLMEDVRNSAIRQLMRIKPQFYYLLFEGSSLTIENAIKVVESIGYPKNKIAIPNLFNLLVDVNDRGANEAMEVLAKIKESDQKTLVEELEIVICKAYSEGDIWWLWGLNSFVENCTDLSKEDFFDKDIFELLKYGDEENYAYDYGIHHFLKT